MAVNSFHPTSYVLTWNPEYQPNGITDKDVSQTHRNIKVIGNWSTGRRKDIQIGDRIYFYSVGPMKGMVGSGKAISECEIKANWNRDSSLDEVPYLDIEWDTLLDHTNRLVPEKLLTVSSLKWDQMQANGQKVKAEESQALERLWQAHLVHVRKEQLRKKEYLNKFLERKRSLSKPSSESIIYPNELNSIEKYFEGSLKTIQVDRYERNSAARKACIEVNGSTCCVCSFDFKKFYGPTGKGIHVHHLTELASIGKEYQLDPTEDLCPVCPNCHAMLHQTRPAMSIKALKKLIDAQAGKRKLKSVR